MQQLILSPDSLVTAGVLTDVLVYSFRTLFFLSAVLLMIIILLQEGKGGGLASALGGQGAETFGVSTGGVNKVTLSLAAIFLLSGLAHAVTYGKSISSTIETKKGKTPIVLPGDSGTGPGGTEAPPPENGDGEPAKDPEKKPEKDVEKPVVPPAPPVDGAGDAKSGDGK